MSNLQRLQTLVDQKTIGRNTLLETDSGQKKLVKQVPGLVFYEHDDEV